MGEWVRASVTVPWMDAVYDDAGHTCGLGLKGITVGRTGVGTPGARVGRGVTFLDRSTGTFSMPPGSGVGVTALG
jgi:hypothetical protein